MLMFSVSYNDASQTTQKGKKKSTHAKLIFHNFLINSRWQPREKVVQDTKKTSRYSHSKLITHRQTPYPTRFKQR